MPDYTQGKIYQIIDDEGKRYIGSTTIKLYRRFSKHIHDNNSNKRKCSSIKLNLDKAEISLLEAYPCNSRKELLQRERYWIEKLECVNQMRPIITKEEKRKYNRDRTKVDGYKEQFNIRRKKWRHFKNSWGFNNYLGTSLNLLDISPDLFK
jgi:hypothetical protein